MSEDMVGRIATVAVFALLVVFVVVMFKACCPKNGSHSNSPEPTIMTDGRGGIYVLHHNGDKKAGNK